MQAAVINDRNVTTERGPDQVADEISALDAARQLQIDLNRLYVLLRLGRVSGRKVDGEWRVSSQSVAARMRSR